jgi:hypothetical protein
MHIVGMCLYISPNNPKVAKVIDAHMTLGSVEVSDWNEA